MASIVKGAKFSGDRTGLPRVMSRLKVALADRRYDAIIGVPSDHMLGDCLCDEWEAHFKASRPNIIRRRRGALRQVGLSRKERRTNAAKCFELAAGDVPQAVLLVDDIVTTGATIEAIATLLVEGGALIVDVVALARARSGYGGQGQRPQLKNANA